MIAWGYSLVIGRKTDFAIGEKDDPRVILLTEGEVVLFDDYSLGSPYCLHRLGHGLGRSSGLVCRGCWLQDFTALSPIEKESA